MAIGDRIDPKEGVAFGVEFSCVRHRPTPWPATAISSMAAV
jgi:hypothetical protein